MSGFLGTVGAAISSLLNTPGQAAAPREDAGDTPAPAPERAEAPSEPERSAEAAPRKIALKSVSNRKKAVAQPDKKAQKHRGKAAYDYRIEAILDHKVEAKGDKVLASFFQRQSCVDCS